MKHLPLLVGIINELLLYTRITIVYYVWVETKKTDD